MLDKPVNPENKTLSIPFTEDDLKGTPKWATGGEKAEERNWGSLDQVKLDNDISWLKHYGLMTLMFGWAFAVIFLLSLSAWVWHYIGLPEAFGVKLYWLDTAHLEKIQSMLFSSGMGAVVSGIIRNQISKS